jgi:uncharacterized delta-60 repeat protein
MPTISRKPRAARPRPELLEARALLTTGGVLDPTFGQGTGSVEIRFPTGTTAHAVAIQPDGKIVVAGGMGTVSGGPQAGFQVARLNPDGSLDPSFGQGGKINIAPAYIVDGLALQGDGKIVLAGRQESGVGVLVARLDPNGQLDPTFGTGGKRAFTFRNDQGYDLVAGVVVQPDGKIVVAGTAGTDLTSTSPPSSSTTYDLAAARLNPDGSADTTFGTAGTAVLPVAVNGRQTDDTARGIALQPDGKIVVTGTANAGFVATAFGGFQRLDLVVIRLDARGVRDPSFGTAGEVLLPPVGPLPPDFTSSGTGVVVQPDGKIVLAGGDPTRFSATRLNPDGSLDPNFGTSGVAGSPLPMSLSSGLSGYSVAVAPDGKIVLAGTAEVPMPNSIFTMSSEPVVRLNPDGTPDRSFGNPATPAVAAFEVGRQPLTANALAIQPDGKIVVVGDAGSTDQSGVMTVFRVTSGTTSVLRQPPASFDGSGRTNLAVFLPSSATFAILTTNGTQARIPFGIPGSGQTIPAPGDYTGAGRTEIAAYLTAYGVYVIRPAGGGPDVAVPFGIPGAGQSIPTPGDYGGTGRDDIAVYMPALGAFGIRPSGGGPDQIVPFGIPGPGRSIPAPGDYFGTGRSDIAVYLPALGAFAIRNPAGGPDQIIPFGPAGGDAVPVPGDYDGSGRTELAVYLPSLGTFAYRPARGGPDVIVPFGPPGGAIPVPGDYDGSGKTELAVYLPSYGTFAYRPRSGPDVVTQFTTDGSGRTIPVAAPPGTIPPPTAPATPAPVLRAAAKGTVPGGPSILSRKAARAPVAQAMADPRKA